MTNVTRPFLPPLEEVLPFLEQIWDSRLLSNGGVLHQSLEAELQKFLGVPYVSLFCNATVALIVAQKALAVRGEVITTPYSFVATANAIDFAGNQPIFSDVDPASMNLDPSKLEAVISDKTAAIMPLHCYGNTCDVGGISDVARAHDIPVIYDACHSFGVEDEGGSTLRHGDISVVSLHATKVFNTFEGGLLVTHSPEMKERIDRLKNFGFVDETTVIDVGINGKMSEFNAAVGLAQLSHYEQGVQRRGLADRLYREHLTTVDGIACFMPSGQIRRNFAYFPIFVTDNFRVSRDDLYGELKAQDIFCRRYFFPLISQFQMYSHLESSDPRHLPVATSASQQVLCLPLFADLELSEVERICKLISMGTR